MLTLRESCVCADTERVVFVLTEGERVEFVLALRESCVCELCLC